MVSACTKKGTSTKDTSTEDTSTKDTSTEDTSTKNFPHRTVLASAKEFK